MAQTLLFMSASRTVLRAGMPTALRRTRSHGDAYIYRDVCATLEISRSGLRETQILNRVSAPLPRGDSSFVSAFPKLATGIPPRGTQTLKSMSGQPTARGKLVESFLIW